MKFIKKKENDSNSFQVLGVYIIDRYVTKTKLRRRTRLKVLLLLEYQKAMLILKLSN